MYDKIVNGDVLPCGHSVKFLYCSLDQEPGCTECNHIQNLNDEIKELKQEARELAGKVRHLDSIVGMSRYGG